MDLRFYLEKLHNSEEFKKFMLENPDAYMCSGFFVIDKEKSWDEYNFDYYVLSTKKMFSFKLGKGIELVPIDMFDKRVPEKLSLDCDFNLDEIERLIREKMIEEKVKSKIQKILLSLQNLEGKDLLTATVFVSGLGILKVNIDLSTKKITDFEKKSFFDMMKIMRKK